jgi:hypothetical protein
LKIACIGRNDGVWKAASRLENFLLAGGNARLPAGRGAGARWNGTPWLNYFEQADKNSAAHWFRKSSSR